MAKNKLWRSDRQENKFFSNSVTKEKEITGSMRYLGKYSFLFLQEVKKFTLYNLVKKKIYGGWRDGSVRKELAG